MCDRRVRLPCTTVRPSQVHLLEKSKPDDYMPVAHTCFFSIEWPKYTTAVIAKKKLLYAIRNCKAIDGDANTAEGRANLSAH